MDTRDAPYVLDETGDFAVVFKPPRMHCAPARAGDGGTLLDWYATLFPGVLELCGRKKGEGGLLHRLDFETNGLVLFAKNQNSLDCLLAQQAEGNFVKEYGAICSKTPDGKRLPSFPPAPRLDGFPGGGFVLESRFRPFGPGRKQVRPVPAETKGGYRTEVLGVSGPNPGGCFAFAARLNRGFRHQVRCHLAWIGYPILNDPLYGEASPGGEGLLALRAAGLTFADPGNGKARKYRIAPLEMPSNSM